MTNAPRLVTLTDRNGRKARLFVTYHVIDWSKGATLCGVTLAQINAQEVRVHQGTLSGDHSDANCSACKAGPNPAEPGTPSGVLDTADIC